LNHPGFSGGGLTAQASYTGPDGVQVEIQLLADSPMASMFGNPALMGMFALALLAACGGDAPDAVTADARSGSGPEVNGTIAARVQDHQWLENAEQFQGRVGERVVYDCGPGSWPGDAGVGHRRLLG